MKNLINYILQHKGKIIFEPILTTEKDYSITSMNLKGINKRDAKSICYELNELLLKVREINIKKDCIDDWRPCDEPNWEFDECAKCGKIN